MVFIDMKMISQKIHAILYRSMGEAMKKLYTILAVLFLASNAWSQAQRGLSVTDLSEGGALGRQYAVLIAVDKYQEWLPLKHPVKDAREIRTILGDRYRIDETIELYNEAATKAGIIKLFSSLIEKTRPEDSVFIFYAGHGHLDAASDTGFWIPQDSGTDTLTQDNWLPNTQIRGFIRNLKARHVLLISDSCFSGDLLNTSRALQPAITDEYFRNAYKRVSRQVLTSGASEAVPDDSPFSQQLKLALSGNRDAFLDPLMMFSEVRRGVKGTTPLFGELNGTGHQDGCSFLFFLRTPAIAGLSSQVAQPGSGPAPDGKATLIIASDPTGAELYIDGKLAGRTPYYAPDAPSGIALNVELRSGNLYAAREVVLRGGETRDLSMKLETLKGNIFIDIDKAGSIAIDGGAWKPFSGGVIRDLASGPHKLEVLVPGLYWEARIAVVSGETIRLIPSFQPASSIKLPADAPQDMRFKVGGREYSATEIATLPPGEHRVSLIHPDFAGINISIMTEKDKVTILELVAFPLSESGKLANANKNKAALLERKHSLGNPVVRFFEGLSGSALSFGGLALVVVPGLGGGGGGGDLPSLLIGGLSMLLGVPLMIDGYTSMTKITNVQNMLWKVDAEIAKLQASQSP